MKQMKSTCQLISGFSLETPTVTESDQNFVYILWVDNIWSTCRSILRVQSYFWKFCGPAVLKIYLSHRYLYCRGTCSKSHSLLFGAGTLLKMAAYKLLWLPIALYLKLLSGHCEGQGLNHVVIFTSHNSDTGVCEFLLTTPAILATVRIQSDLGMDEEYTVRRQDAQRVRVECQSYRTSLSGETERKALLLTSDQIIVVQGINQNDGSADGFLAVPPTEDATEFVVSSYMPFSSYSSQFFLAASADDTQVTIRYRDQSTEVVTLNLFETYGRQSNEIDYTGTIVTSDKPIVVFSGHECAQVPEGRESCNHLVSAVPPVEQLGTQFIVPPIDGRLDSGYIIRVVAARDNTFVDAGSHGIQSLNAGESIDIDIPDEEEPMGITCTYGCLVMQYNKGSDVDLMSSGPFMMVVTPVQHYANRFHWLTPTREGLLGYDHLVSIIVPSSETEGVRLDGDALTLSDWRVAEGSDYSATALAVDDGQHTVDHENLDVQLSVFTHGHSFESDEAYAFPAGTDVPRSVLTNTTTTTTTIPPPTTVSATEPPVLTTEPPVVETTQPPVVETTLPPVLTTQQPVVETTQPPVVTTLPPVVETTQPPVVETTMPPEVTTQPPVVETTQPPVVETTQPPVVTTQPPVVETTQPPIVETTQPPVESTQPPVVETTMPPEVTTQPPVVETTQPPIETTQPPVVETTQPSETTTIPPPTPTPGPDDVTPPVQLISVRGSFSAASSVSPECSQRHNDAFLQRASGVVQQINSSLGDTMCQFFPQGATSISQYGADLFVFSPADNQGEVYFTVEVPAVPVHNYDDNHRCGVEIQTFMQEHSNYEQPVFPPVEGCPNLTPDIPGWFEENFRRWQCVV